MKSPALMLAFFASTAIHVGAITSNLLHVNAQNSFENRVQSVKLHIVPAAIRTPSLTVPDVRKKENPRSEPQTSPVQAPQVSPPYAVPMVKAGEIEAPEKETLPKTLPAVVPHILAPAHILPPAEPSFEAVAAPVPEYTSVEAPNEMSDGEPAVYAAMSLPPKREFIGRSVVEDSSPAMITGLSKPGYPRLSRIHGEEGSTILSIEIHADGELGHIEVVQSSGYKRLDKAAIKSIKKAGFIPAQKNGRSISSKKQIAFRFNLEEEE